MISGFHYLPCPLCQCNVNQSEADDFYALPLERSLAKLLVCGNWQVTYSGSIISNDIFSSKKVQAYPPTDYRKRLLLFHPICFDFIKDLSYSQLYLLIDVVEPTFLNRSFPPVSKYGAFSSLGSDFHPPRWTNLDLFKRLPHEIQDMVLAYDIGRLLFVIRAASQIAAQHEGLETMPERRLTQENYF